MDPGENWKLDETNWLSHGGIHSFASVKGDNELPEGVPALFALDQLGSTSVCYKPTSPVQVLEDTGFLYQDHQLFTGRHEVSPLTAEVISAKEKAAEEALCTLHPPSFCRVPEAEMRGAEEVAAGTVLQRLIQERLRYGTPSENMNLLAIQHQATGSAGPSNSTASTLSSAENLAPEEPPMLQPSGRQEPQGQEHQGDGAAMEKQPRAPQPPHGTEELPTYEEAKAQSQFFRGQAPPGTAAAPGFYGTSGQKCRTEGRPTVNRANSGQAHKDEALKELKQGHVRSLSERIMQLSLERNGAKQHPPAPGVGKVFKAAPAPGKAADPRGPPPEYPYKGKVAAPGSKAQDHGLFYGEQPAQDVLKASYGAPQPARAEAALVRYQPPPEYGVSSRQCQPPFPPPPVQQHSPMSSQAAAGPGPLLPGAMSPLPAPAAAQPLTPTLPGQQLTPDAFAIVERAQQMVEMLSEENHVLRQELEGYYEKADKLQKPAPGAAVFCTICTVSRTAERLETANRQLASRDFDGHEEKATEGLYVTQNKEHLKEKEKLEMELAAVRSANEDQRRHIEILDQALNNAQAKVIKLEEELRRKQAYVEKVEKLQQALTQLQAACEKREQMERRLRTRLERELDSLRMQQRQGSCQASSLPEHNAPALMELVREKEERILALEADMTKWEQKYLEESTIRHFAMNAAATAATERDTSAPSHSRNGSYGESALEVRSWQEEEEIVQANRRCQDMEYTIKNLHAKIIEKDAMIKVLQQRSRKDPGKADSASLRPARSVPSIAAATGVHSRQTSLTSNQIAEEKKEEKIWKGSIGLLLGKEHHDHPSGHSLPPPLPSLSCVPVPVPAASHAKTGSKDSSTQTDKSTELFWPAAASFPGRGRLGTTPAHSPAPRPPGTRAPGEKLENSSHGKLPDSKGRVSSLLHKPEFPDTDMMEVLI
ncbi:angiomotin-like protein 1 [Melanerpes formicivorus]|uniref:angiomotin-like protein 1 n=1 Tax=Melanerpes formicivorus TaxID=211600 RepID=UPI00358EDF4E